MDELFSKRWVLPAVLCLMASLYADDTQARSLEAEHQCLALALYWEARGETHHGMVAVGWTILNRARSSKFPGTPCGVIYQGGEQAPCQFSWWCDGKSDKPRNYESWMRARLVATELLMDPPPDPTGRALFFHSSSIRAPWKHKRTRTARIGSHVFYR